MSANRFGSYRPRMEDPYAKDLTPKTGKYSPKVSPVFNSLKSNLGIIRPETSKSKLKPNTTKHSN